LAASTTTNSGYLHGRHPLERGAERFIDAAGRRPAHHHVLDILDETFADEFPRTERQRRLARRKHPQQIEFADRADHQILLVQNRKDILRRAR